MTVNLSPAAPPTSKPIKNTWTIMVYLAGNNNLAEEMVYALKSMQLVGSDPPSKLGKRTYQVFALYDAGVAPVTLTIKDRGTPQGVPPPEDLQKMAKKALQRSLKDAEAARKAAEVELDRRTQLHRRLLLSLPTLTIKPGLKPKPNPEVEASEQAVKEAEDICSNAKRRLADAKSALSGGPLRLETVQTTLSNFVVQTILEHPAKHYMLVLSGHGSGAVGDFLVGNTHSSGLSVPDLRDALSTVQELFRKDANLFRKELPSGKIDILGMDSCLMGMAEVAYEVSPYVDFLIGAEGFEPNTGWPYDRILSLFRKSPRKNPGELAVGIVREYIKTYTSDYTLADVSTDHSALDLSKIDRFAKALAGEHGLAQLLHKALEKESEPGGLVTEKVLLAHWEAQGYKNEQHVDIWDFCNCLQARCSSTASLSSIVSACRKVKSAVQALVKKSKYCGPEFQYSRGLSIFFPWANMTDAVGFSEIDHYGSGLGFAQHTQWDEFLRAYHKSTRRKVRPGDGKSHPSTMNHRTDLFTGEAEPAIGPGLGLLLIAISVNPSALQKSRNPLIRALSSNPNIRALSSNPNIRALSSNPNIRGLVRALSSNPNIRALSSNPNIRALSSNPNIRAAVRALSSNPNIRALSSNPNIRALSSNPNIRALSSNPNIRALSSNPNIRALSSNPNIRALSSNPNIRALSSNPNIRALSSNPNIRMSGGGGGDLPKIASMKNPAVRWQEPREE